MQENIIAEYTEVLRDGKDVFIFIQYRDGKEIKTIKIGVSKDQALYLSKELYTQTKLAFKELK